MKFKLLSMINKALFFLIFVCVCVCVTGGKEGVEEDLGIKEREGRLISFLTTSFPVAFSFFSFQDTPRDLLL